MMLGFGVSQQGGTWLRKDIPMNLNLFEYIAHNVLLIQINLSPLCPWGRS